MPTKREQLLEVRQHISRYMDEIGINRDIWQNDAIWWLCKAVLLLLDKEIKK